MRGSRYAGCPLVGFQAGRAVDHEPACVVENDYAYLASAQPSSYNDHWEISRIIETINDGRIPMNIMLDEMLNATTADMMPDMMPAMQAKPSYALPGSPDTMPAMQAKPSYALYA